MTQELRQATRYDVEVSAEVYIPTGLMAATTRNLSDTGVCLDMDIELPENGNVGLSLFLITDGIEDPDAEPLNIKAKVVWTSPRDHGGFSSGMRFDTSNTKATDAIHQFLTQLNQ